MMKWPSLFSYLPSDLPQLNKFICVRAAQDIGQCEDPPSSNRGERIDEYNTRAGAPLGSFWCASFVTAVYEDCFALVPPEGRASCDVLVDWAEEHGIWTPYDPTKPVPDHVREGSMVVYTNGTPLPGGKGKLDAVHVGILVRVKPYLMSLEGNAAYGGAFSNNGEAVVVRRVELRRVYGFIAPKVDS